MLDANIPDIALERDKTVKKVILKIITKQVLKHDFFLFIFSYSINFVLTLMMKKQLVI